MILYFLMLILAIVNFMSRLFFVGMSILGVELILSPAMYSNVWSRFKDSHREDVDF